MAAQLAALAARYAAMVRPRKPPQPGVGAGAGVDGMIQAQRVLRVAKDKQFPGAYGMKIWKRCAGSPIELHVMNRRAECHGCSKCISRMLADEQSQNSPVGSRIMLDSWQADELCGGYETPPTTNRIE